MTGRVSFAFAILFAILAGGTGAAAQTCTARDFGAVVDQTAQALRELNGAGSRRYEAKVAQLRDKHGLSQAEIDNRTQGLQDEKIESFNRDIESMVAQMDVLSQTPSNKITCEKLDELKRTRDRLLTVMGQKSGYMLAKVEAELEGPGKAAPQQAAAAPAPQAEPVRPVDPVPPPAAAPAPAPRPLVSAENRPVDLRPNAGEFKAPPPVASADRPPVTGAAGPLPEKHANAEYLPPPAMPERAPPGGAARMARNTAPTTRDLPPPPPMDDADRPTALAAPPGGAPLPPPGMEGDSEEGYSISEIREAGRGIFGAINAEFGGAINYAFQNYGRPNAYIVGVEGGAAFVAGLRYGKGTIYRKSSPAPDQIYWQGPSAGLDFGAEGGRALFLVYNLDDPYAIYGRFSGIGGAAYVAGGVGLNVLGKGGVVMVPIRSGLGLRLGANLAYVKFTERQTWNPF